MFRDGGRSDIYTPEIEITKTNINQRISVILNTGPFNFHMEIYPVPVHVSNLDLI